MAEISVILPIHNGAAYLDETLRSLRAQSFADFEVLCIDDCSTDDSAAIVRRHAAEDARFLYLHTGTNLGSAPRTINHAAPAASGKWFVYSSQDDLFSADWLQKMHARALATGADAVLPDVVFYHAGRSDCRTLAGYLGHRAAVITGREAFVASLDWRIPGNAMWPIAFLKSGGYDDFGAFADEYTVRRFFLQCTRVAFCDGVFFYRQDNASAITKSPSRALLDLPETNLRLWRMAVEQGFGPEVHGPFALRTLRSALRAQALIFNTPSLAESAGTLRKTWDAMQASAQFQVALTAAATSPGRRLATMPYRKAARSWTWFQSVARLSALVARGKRTR